jgi:hypothetical protein
MRNKKPYLNLYKESLACRMIPIGCKDGQDRGLCGLLGKDVMEIFTPSKEECSIYNVYSWGYYASDFGYDLQRGFGPTRQNMVLLLAAMNGEL